MKKVSEKDKLFYFEKNFFTLDGLWIIEAENFTDFETALEIDKAVWQRLIPIVFRRIKKYLRIETNTIKDIIDILSFRWSCEGWEYEVLKKGVNRYVPAYEISEHDFEAGNWQQHLDALFEAPYVQTEDKHDGAKRCAEMILVMVHKIVNSSSLKICSASCEPLQ